MKITAIEHEIKFCRVIAENCINNMLIRLCTVDGVSPTTASVLISERLAELQRGASYKHILAECKRLDAKFPAKVPA